MIPFGIVPLEPATTGVSTVGQAKKGRPIVPKIEGLPHQLIGNNIQVLIQDPMMSIPKIDYIKDDRGDPALEETDNLLSLLSKLPRRGATVVNPFVEAKSTKRRFASKKM